MKDTKKLLNKMIEQGYPDGICYSKMEQRRIRLFIMIEGFFDDC